MTDQEIKIKEKATTLYNQFYDMAEGAISGYKSEYESIARKGALVCIQNQIDLVCLIGDVYEYDFYEQLVEIKECLTYKF